jgi:uncharacterized protein (TIGR00290 family)
MAEQVILSWSGGKDSSLALAALQRDPRVEVVGLLTSVTRGYDRVSIHGVRRALLEAQVAATGLPLFEVVLEPASSNSAYEDAFLTALEQVREGHPGVRRIAFGDLFLEDVRAYREQLLARGGYEATFPLWGENTRTLAERFVAQGFGARLVCVDTSQLSTDFAGREFDRALLADLPDAVDPCGERGEFHTFVWRGPILASEIPVRAGKVVLREERFAFCDLLPAAVPEPA